jgi:hypothetical protein
MSQRKRVLITLFTIFVAAALPLSAQESNSSKATAGLFGTDVDDYLDVHGWSGVELEKYFGFAGYEGLHRNLPVLGLGYARQFGGLYVGAYYTGNAAASGRFSDPNWIFGNNVDEEEIVASYDPSGQPTTTTTTTTYNGSSIFSYNTVKALFGFAGMGITVGVREDLVNGLAPNAISTKTERVAGSTTSYNDKQDSYSYTDGYIIPTLGWGMILSAGGLKIKPKLDVEVAFNRHSRESKTSDYTMIGTAIDYAGGYSATHDGYNYNSIAPQFTVGADMVLANQSGLETTFGLSYGVGFDIYSNDLSGYGSSGSVKGGNSFNSTRFISQTANTRTETDAVNASVEELSALRNTIIPSFKITNEIGDRLRLGFKTLVKIGINTSTNNAYGQDFYSTTVTSLIGDLSAENYQSVTDVITGSKTKESVLSVNPIFSAGAQYQLIPDRFTLNAGIAATFTFTRTTERVSPQGYDYSITYERDGYGNVIQPNVYSAVPKNQTDSLTVTQVFDDLTAFLGGGFTFFFTPKFTVDTAFSAGYAGRWDLNLANVNILFTLKN